MYNVIEVSTDKKDETFEEEDQFEVIPSKPMKDPQEDIIQSKLGDGVNPMQEDDLELVNSMNLPQTSREDNVMTRMNSI